MPEYQLNCLGSIPNWVRTYDFGNDFSVVELSRTWVREYKPIYSGQAILDVSKMLLYKFHCGYMAAKHGSRQHLLYSDTDSMIYQIQTKDFYADKAPDINMWFDMSNYPPTIDRPLPEGHNKKVLTKMKR